MSAVTCSVHIQLSQLRQQYEVTIKQFLIVNYHLVKTIAS